AGVRDGPHSSQCAGTGPLWHHSRGRGVRRPGRPLRLDELRRAAKRAALPRSAHCCQRRDQRPHLWAGHWLAGANASRFSRPLDRGQSVELKVPAEGFEIRFPGKPEAADTNQGDMAVRTHKLELPSERSDFAVQIVDASKTDLSKTDAARKLNLTLDKDATPQDYQKVLLAIMDDMVQNT